MPPDTLPPKLESLGLTPESAASLPEGIRRQAARFLLRWRGGREALPLLPDPDDPEAPRALPRDRFDCCRALLAAGKIDRARDLARELLNAPDAGPWGHRAVGEVFLALGRAERADERFRAGGDAAGRARAHLALGNREKALDLLRDSEDPEAERLCLETRGDPGLRELYEAER